MNLKTLLGALALWLAMGTSVLRAQQTQVIAHRGFWKTEGSAQNSIRALVKADSIGCYGSEFDVWLTADDQLVVNHDATFKGVIMQEATARVCTAVELDNGESLPLLCDYLAEAKKLSTRLILELKAHKTPEQETRAVERIVRLMHEMELESRVEYITFSAHALRELIRQAPNGTPVYYLEGDLTPAALKELGAAGPDYHYNVFRQHPEWIKECHDLGMKVNAWTVNEAEKMEWLLSEGVDFLTTNEPLLLQSLIRKQ